MGNLIQASYLLVAVLFILGLKQMSSLATARSGIVWAGVGMLLAGVITLFWPALHNYLLMLLALAVGSALAWYAAKRVAMTDMPQMIAIYNGMGGGAAGAIGALELMRTQGVAEAQAADAALAGLSQTAIVLAVLGALIGSVSFSGSLIAFAKLQGLINRSIIFAFQNYFNLAVLGLALLTGLLVFFSTSSTLLALFFGFALAFGILMTLPIGGADMPVVISLYNALTGLAVGLEGFVLDNAALIIAGTVVGASGTLLTQLMAKAMNRSLGNVLFSGFGSTLVTSSVSDGTLKPIEAPDAGLMMAYSEQVVVVPGYGMAVAQAQHKVWELARLLEGRGVTVKFAIHPVAGRMPGHMNVLLAEAGVPYDKIYDMEAINAEFPTTDVALIIGANDVVNPAARSDPGSPLYGMPILDADRARNVVVIKRGQGAGFSGVQNTLFFKDNTRMLYGDGQTMSNELIQAIKQL
jgi:NAD/NADP transhydrogenase beta subunit